MRNLIERVVEVLKKRNVFPIRTPAVVVVVITTAQIREPRREADHQPFLQVERLKKNFLHQLERLAEWREDLDLVATAVHGTI